MRYGAPSDHRAQLDNRAGAGRIASRIGIGQNADTYDASPEGFTKIELRIAAGPCVFLQYEAHFE
jgi:thymidine kinase